MRRPPATTFYIEDCNVFVGNVQRAGCSALLALVFLVLPVAASSLVDVSEGLALSGNAVIAMSKNNQGGLVTKSTLQVVLKKLQSSYLRLRVANAACCE
jgi:hypothetical protein